MKRSVFWNYISGNTGMSSLLYVAAAYFGANLWRFLLLFLTSWDDMLKVQSDVGVAQQGVCIMSRGQIVRKVKVEGNYLNFSSAHFITYGGKCEHLHGHNYEVLIEIEGTLGEDKLIFDFTVLKRLTKEICRRLDHRFLLPLHNPHLTLHASPTEWEILFGQRRYVFPRQDVVEMPIDNSTAERIAEYIGDELCAMLVEYDTSRLSTLLVGVAEAPMQMAYYQRSLRE